MSDERFNCHVKREPLVDGAWYWVKIPNNAWECAQYLEEGIYDYNVFVRVSHNERVASEFIIGPRILPPTIDKPCHTYEIGSGKTEHCPECGEEY